MIHDIASFSGRYRLTVHRLNESGEVDPASVKSYEFNNLITNSGLDMLFTSGFADVCRVGSGTTEPSITDTALASQVAWANGTVAAGPAGDGYSSAVWTYVFAQGVAAGNLSEVGTSPASSGNLFSRARILDVDGNPTTITVTSIDILTVTYELRLYRATGDVTDTMTIGGASYTVVSRPSRVQDSNALRWAQNGPLHSGFDGAIAYSSSASLGPITGSPTGTNIGKGGGSRNSYVAGTHYREATATFTPSQGNAAGGIKVVETSANVGVTHQPAGVQVSFTPALPKDNTKSLQLTFRVSWGRHTP